MTTRTVAQTSCQAWFCRSPQYEAVLWNMKMLHSSYGAFNLVHNKRCEKSESSAHIICARVYCGRAVGR